MTSGLEPNGASPLTRRRSTISNTIRKERRNEAAAAARRGSSQTTSTLCARCSVEAATSAGARRRSQSLSYLNVLREQRNNCAVIDSPSSSSCELCGTHLLSPPEVHGQKRALKKGQEYLLQPPGSSHLSHVTFRVPERKSKRFGRRARSLLCAVPLRRK